MCIADPSQPWHQSLKTVPHDVCSLHNSRVWAAISFIYCLSQQFREGTNVNKVDGLLSSAFKNKAKTKGVRTNWKIMLMPCLDLSLQICCNLKPPELVLPGEQDDSIRLGIYDVVGKKGLFIRVV